MQRVEVVDESPDKELAGMLRVEKVAKRFNDASGSLDVLESVSLTLPHAGVVSLVGPTGCGKTTLLRIIARLERATSGLVTFNGETLAARRISIVFQQPTLLGWRTLYENVRLPLELANADLRKWEPEIKQVITAVGLSNFENYRPARMSGGMQARAALARALLQHPSILLLDEPFASIDEIRRTAMYALLIGLFAQYETSGLLVTHSISEAVLLSDTVVVLSARPAVVVGSLDILMPKEKRLAEPDHEDLIEARGKIRHLLEMGTMR